MDTLRCMTAESLLNRTGINIGYICCCRSRYADAGGFRKVAAVPTTAESTLLPRPGSAPQAVCPCGSYAKPCHVWCLCHFHLLSLHLILHRAYSLYRRCCPLYCIQSQLLADVPLHETGRLHVGAIHATRESGCSRWSAQILPARRGAASSAGVGCSEASQCSACRLSQQPGAAP